LEWRLEPHILSLQLLRFEPHCSSPININETLLFYY